MNNQTLKTGELNNSLFNESNLEKTEEGTVVAGELLVPDLIFEQAEDFNMRPLSVDHMKDHKHQFGAVATYWSTRGGYCGEELGGYCAATGVRSYKDDTYIVIGSLIVLEEYRGQGLGSKLVEMTVNSAVNELLNPEYFGLITICNDVCTPIFEQNGFKFVEQQDDEKNVLVLSFLSAL